MRKDEGLGFHSKAESCFLCKARHLEKDIQPIEVLDQAGYVQKLGVRSVVMQS